MTTKTRAKQMRAEGMSWVAIGRRLGITPKQVANWCRDDRTDHEQKAIAELRAEGAPESVILAVFGRV